MSYTGPDFVNDNPPSLNASNLNGMVEELEKLDPYADEVDAARVGADGKTYSDLGTAIRTQVSNLQNQANEQSVFGYYTLKDISNYLVTGKFVNCRTKAETANAEYEYVDYPITPGKTYRITGYGRTNSSWYPTIWGASSYITYYHITQNGKFVWTFTAPENAVSVVFNGIPGGQSHCQVEELTFSEQARTFNQEFDSTLALIPQVTSLGNELKKQSIFGYYVDKDISSYIVTGKQINCHTKEVITNADYEYAIVPITPGKSYKISGYAYSTNSAWNPHIWGENAYITYKVLSQSGHFEWEFTAPDNAVSVIFNGLNGSAVNGCKAFDLTFSEQAETFNQEFDELKKSIYDTFNIQNLERRMLKAEHNNDFVWTTFRKAYFVFIHDDTNQYLEDFATAFLNKNVPMSESAIVENINETHLATMQSLVAAGGEILAHYNASPTESSPDSLWLACTRDVKMALEELGFTIRGIIRANDTGTETNKGEKYCRLYFDYANDKMGKSIQYDLPRTLVSHWSSLASFKSYIDTAAQTPGIYAFGFHGGRESEAWFSPENVAEIVDYINAKENCEITTYSAIYDEYASCALLERIKALEDS